MNTQERKDVLSELLYQKYGSCESLVYISEQFNSDEVREADLQMYSALKRLDEAASDVVTRMEELDKELDLGFEEEYGI